MIQKKWPCLDGPDQHWQWFQSACIGTIYRTMIQRNVFMFHSGVNMRSFVTIYPDINCRILFLATSPGTGKELLCDQIPKNCLNVLKLFVAWFCTCSFKIASKILTAESIAEKIITKPIFTIMKIGLAPKKAFYVIMICICKENIF